MKLWRACRVLRAEKPLQSTVNLMAAAKITTLQAELSADKAERIKFRSALSTSLKLRLILTTII